MISPMGNLINVMGNGEPGVSDGNIDQGRLCFPTALALDKSGNLFVVDCQGNLKNFFN
jgi:hypothetical protein